jgi:hypothetical protein
MIEMDFYGIYFIPKFNGDKVIDLNSKFFNLLINEVYAN